MSESDSVYSNATSSPESEEEVFLGAAGGHYLPYQHEPILSSAENSGEDEREERMAVDDEPEDDDGIRPAVLRDRFEGNVHLHEWCRCGKCRTQHLISAREFRCCHEVHAVYGKLVFEGLTDRINCITEYEAYSHMIYKDVLLMAGPLLRQSDGRAYRRRANDSENEYLRAVAYRWLVRWFFGYLGWDNRRPLPACIYNHIRLKYSDGRANTGYRHANEGQ